MCPRCHVYPRSLENVLLHALEDSLILKICDLAQARLLVYDAAGLERPFDAGSFLFGKLCVLCPPARVSP
jgi:hypothetical protein